MKIHTLLVKLNLGLALGLLGGFAPPAAVAGDSAFIYQGCLTVDGIRDWLNGFDLRFKLFDAATGGNQIGQNGYDRPDVTYIPAAGNYSVLFTVPLDFGADAFFPGTGWFPGLMPRWLEIAVRPATNFEAAPYTVLSPRQQITPAPQALYAAMAGTVPAGSLTSSNLAPGAVRTINLEDGAVTGPKIAPGTLLRSLNGLKDDVQLMPGEGALVTTVGNNLMLGITRSCGDYTNCYWNLLGNGNVTSNNFLGTTINVPLEVRVNNVRAMRYDFTAAGSAPNIIGGYAGNTVSGTGGTIAGGGGAGAVNIVGSSWGTIGGGRTNVVLATGGTIGGGESNFIQLNSPDATISGGTGNLIKADAYFSTISGGANNGIDLDTDAAVIGGGNRNLILTHSDYSAIGGGQDNKVTARWAGIGAGAAHEVNSDYATVGGGEVNSVATASPAVTVSGGSHNQVLTYSPYSALGGGHYNIIASSSPSSTVSGGESNVVYAAALGGAIGGGRLNAVLEGAAYATIPGGSGAAATNYGQLAYASGFFDEPGDAQTSIHVLRTTTVGTVTNELFLDGTGRRLQLRPGTTMTFDIQVAGRSAGESAVGYQFRGTIERSTAGVTEFVSPVETVMTQEEVAALDFRVEADEVHDALVLKAVGAGTLNMRWVATVRTTEVKW